MRTTLNDVEIAKYFTEKGREFCLDLKNKDSIYFNKSKASYFSVAAALSLCWTKHAKYDEEFILYASDFIDGNTQVNNKIIELNSLRFGIDNLSNTLMNFRKFYRRIKELMPDFDTCSVNDINKLQSLLLTRLSNYRNNNEITAISTWLFLGPFKIILGNQERLWNVNGINAITLPTGLEVNKGIIKLKKFIAQAVNELTNTLLNFLFLLKYANNN